MLRFWQIVDKSLLKVWSLAYEKFSLLHLINVYEIYAQFQDIEFILKAKFDYTSGSIDKSAWLKILPR